MSLGIFWSHRNAFLTTDLFFLIFHVFLLYKIKKNISDARKNFQKFPVVDYIFLSLHTKFQVKIQSIEFFRGVVTTQGFQCFLVALLQCLISLFKGGGACLPTQQPLLEPWPPPLPLTMPMLMQGIGGWPGVGCRQRPVGDRRRRARGGRRLKNRKNGENMAQKIRSFSCDVCVSK